MTTSKRNELIKKINELKTGADNKTASIYNEIIAELSNEKKYGLVWDRENTIEDVVQNCINNIPILTIDESKTINKGGENNLLIEGDNYHSLLALNMVMKESIDVIYIDPPYNTGHEDFIYNDNFVNEDDGYRHSKWLSFMERRLRLARELLKENGIIIISIDEIEQANLKLLCNSIFGELNFMNCISIKMSESSGVKMSHVESRLPKIKEYCLIYAKNILKTTILPIEKNKLDDIEEFKKYSKYYSKIIVNKDDPVETREIVPIKQYIKDNNLRVMNDEDLIRFKLENSERVVYRTNNKALSKLSFDSKTAKVISSSGLEYIWWETKQMLFLSDYTKTYEGDFWSDISTINLNKEGGVDFLNGKKPLKLIKKLLSIIKNKNSIVLDFFAGSGSTGEAVLELNKEDGGNRKFILCTNNENNICEDVTYQRLKTVITGKRKDKSKYSDGLEGSLYYLRTDFVSNSNNTDQAKYNISDKLDALLCLKENIFNQVEKVKFYSHYVDDSNNHLFIYNEYYNQEKFEVFLKKVKEIDGHKIIYIFSVDNTLDDTLFENIDDIEVKTMGSKQFEIYKEIIEEIKNQQ